ncbi:toxin [Massilia sp. TWR1-2-2]|uniref:toxin n=1 Tax=Massilia sp. TWR1-2-2 TaxID=2804584 RepID=UPI003CE9191B
MRATFVELPPFLRHRADYLDDQAYRELQNELMKHPEARDVIAGTGGLRKLRYADRSRGKGKRGGLRVIYYWRVAAEQFWLFTLYDKDEAADLSTAERKALSAMLNREMEARSKK